MVLKQILKILLVTSSIWFCVVQKVSSQQIQNESAIAKVLLNSRTIREIPRLGEVKPTITSAQRRVQTPTPETVPTPEVVQVTGVKANPTSKGVEIILQTSIGQQLQLLNRSAGNSFITDIPNAQLRLPSGEASTFRSDKPIAGLGEITVINLDAKTIRVTVTGEASLPIVELYDSPDEGLIFSVASVASSVPSQQPPQTPQKPQAGQPGSQTQPSLPSASGDEPIELVVTGEQDGYNVPDASTATKTDTPRRDIPQAIEVVPQQVIRDQQANRLIDVLKNVPGVAQTQSSRAAFANNVSIRGFDASNSILKDGLLDRSLATLGYDLVTVDRIEVLKGPASVLFGQGSLGGTVNLVTKQPLRDPYYFLEGSFGSFDFYRGAIDLSGPVNVDKTLLYRLNAAAQTTGSFLDFYSQQRYNVAPTLTWQINDRAKLTLAAEYYQTKAPNDFGIPALGSVLPNPNGKIPRNRYVGEPFDNNDNRVYRVGYNFEYRFSNNWQVRSALRASFLTLDRESISGTLATDQRNYNRNYYTQYFSDDIYNFDTYVVGKFATGSIKHQIVTGLNLSRQDTYTIKSHQQYRLPISIQSPVRQQTNRTCY